MELSASLSSWNPSSSALLYFSNDVIFNCLTRLQDKNSELHLSPGDSLFAEFKYTANYIITEISLNQNNGKKDNIIND